MALNAKGASFEAHSGLERKKALHSNWVVALQFEAILDFRGPEAKCGKSCLKTRNSFIINGPNVVRNQ